MKKENNKNKLTKNSSHSLANKILLIIISLLIITFVTTGIIINNKIHNITEKLIKQEISSQAKSIGLEINNFFHEKALIVETMSNTNSIIEYIKETENLTNRNQAKSVNSYSSVLKTLQNIKQSDEDLGLVYIGLEANNNFVSNDKNFQVSEDFSLFERDWYTGPIKSKKTYFTSPYIDIVTGKLVISIGNPIFDNTKSIGATAIDVSLDKLSEIISKYKIGNNSYPVLIDSNGLVIYHPDSSFINTHLGENSEELGHIVENMLAGKNDIDEYKYNNIDNIIAYYPITSNNWSVAMVIEKSYVTNYTNSIRNIIIIIYIIVCILISTVIFIIIKKSLKYIPNILNGLNDVSNGNLRIQLNNKSNDEIGQIVSNFNIMVSKIKSLVLNSHDISQKVGHSSSNLASISEEVSNSSEEISKTIDEIARGMSEQAADTDNGARLALSLGDTIDKLAADSKDMIEKAQHAVTSNEQGIKAVEELKEKTELNNNAIDKIKNAINNLEHKSNDIGSILNTISSIAEQTNLLSLNASIEAARAGEYGKGFAVVANEIRQLAEGSQNAAEEIQVIVTNLQDESSTSVLLMKEVNERTVIQSQAVQEVNHSFQHINHAMEDIKVRIDSITEIVSDITVSKDKIIDSIQNISAVSEETAASTQEISSSVQEQFNAIDEVANSAISLNELIDNLNKEISKFQL
ncbi:methyl-accepting chemotaxis protein [Vallitalea maricola]|uniref:Methyl-accepting chemotaxis protein n=1 Tax=Vallitalea maricola TaxID=3074433 RepID=A0ACB5UKY1_9FIRM|nr:methyl-accepting chemotaxis protein [Vallitalea sp. AN17-2]